METREKKNIFHSQNFFLYLIQKVKSPEKEVRKIEIADYWCEQIRRRNLVR